MKVFLVVPRCLNPKQTYREYPLGVGMIATALRRLNSDVAIYDQNAEGPDDEAFFARLRDFAPDIAGFSIITPNYPVAQLQIQRLRREHPEVFIIAGGVHAGLFPEDILADGADAVAMGDGCSAMSALVDRLGSGRPWKGLPGIVCKDETGRVVRPATAAKLISVEDLEIVDRDVYNLPLYAHHSMLASLGCPHRCTFCCNYAAGILQNGVIVRSCDALCREMRYLADRYQAKQVFFADDLFLLTREHVFEFCRRLQQERLAMTWIAQMRVDAVDPETASALAESGCQRIYFGVESGSEAILGRVCKGIDLQSIRRGINSAKNAGMRVKTGWIFGLPGSFDEQCESIGLMRELRPHEISIHQFIPFPGTMYYDRPAEHGVRIRNPKDFASFCYGGLSENISFDYLSRREMAELLQRTVAVLESEGYVSSDRASARDAYVYSTPLNSVSMSVFRS